MGASLSLVVGLALCYGFRPDACAAVTVFPPWLWLLPLLLGVAVAGRTLGRRYALPMLACCGAFLLTLAEEPHSLFRFAAAPDVRIDRSPGVIRVVSLNCGGGLPEAAAEVERWRPDVVLLQEVPVRSAVEAVARRLYGPGAGIVLGLDTAVIARRAAAVGSPRKRRYFVLARVTMPDAGAVDVVSLRLTPPLVRMDLWSPDCWRAQRENREARRAEMTELLDDLAALHEDTPRIMGGDFNAPAGDAVPRMLAPRLRDSFREAGQGWGNTALNDIPVTRIDQVWISRHFRARGVIARKTVHSDHRIVVCDLSRR
ncbi:MAG: endonuclease/exonuclease/phosphatase family protein [Actinomycetota bacterium]